MKNLLKKVILFLTFVVAYATTSFASTNSNDELYVKNVLGRAFEIIKDVDIDRIKKELNDENSKEYVSGALEFFDDYPATKDILKRALGEIDYEILSVKTIDDKIVANVSFLMPDYKDITGKVLKKFMLKNIFKLLKKEFVIDDVVSILELLDEELANRKANDNTYKSVSFTYDFVFKKQKNAWVIINANETVEKILSALNLNKFIK